MKLLKQMRLTSTISNYANSKWFAFLLNLMLPGAGHFFYREYIFGVFIWLIWLIAAGLFYLSFLIELNFLAKVLLFSLPLVFYFFTFFDLASSIKRKKTHKLRNFSFSVSIFAVSFVYQVFAPTAPLNFMIANGPVPFVLNDNRLAPIHSKGTLMKASRLAYKADIIGFSKPIFHHFPERYDIVRYQSENGSLKNAVAIGLPQEVIEIVEGTVIINGLPDFEGWIGGVSFTGNYPPETVTENSLLVATLKLGSIDELFQIHLQNVVGKVEPVF
jgi:hypothetical protein